MKKQMFYEMVAYIIVAAIVVICVVKLIEVLD